MRQNRKAVKLIIVKCYLSKDKGNIDLCMHYLIKLQTSLVPHIVCTLLYNLSVIYLSYTCVITIYLLSTRWRHCIQSGLLTSLNNPATSHWVKKEEDIFMVFCDFVDLNASCEG